MCLQEFFCYLCPMKPMVYFQDWGVISYQTAWDRQQQLLKKVIDFRSKNLENTTPQTVEHQLIFCEHPPVFTLGRSGSIKNLLLSEDELKDKKIEFFKINRGGDITFHGLGQIVGYPIFDLNEFFTDVHRYVRSLEEVIILTLAEYGLLGIRVPKFTGVWLAEDEKNKKKRKICAIGIHLSRWVTMHGFAFNVNTDLSYFQHIVPCGISDDDKEVTSLQNELGYFVDRAEVTEKLIRNFSQVFDFQYFNK